MRYIRSAGSRLILLLYAMAILSACGSGNVMTAEEPAPAVTDSQEALPEATATDAPTATSSPSSGVSPLPTATSPVSPIARPQAPTEPVYTYEVVAEYPFDPTIWTQGLVYTDGVLYVGGGLRGQSDLRKTDLVTGETLQSTPLADEYFGEGVAVLGDRVYQLTWQENTGFVYNKEDFSLEGTFAYETEGWGLTHDGERLIMSDGTDTIYFRDPETLAETGRVSVRSSLGPLGALNELEYINGEILANVWTTDWIARIDPESGNVLGWINLAGLLGPAHRADGQANILNGIAYDEEEDRLFVTGKFWPRLFEIELVPIQ